MRAASLHVAVHIEKKRCRVVWSEQTTKDPKIPYENNQASTWGLLKPINSIRCEKHAEEYYTVDEASYRPPQRDSYEENHPLHPSNKEAITNYNGSEQGTNCRHLNNWCKILLMINVILPGEAVINKIILLTLICAVRLKIDLLNPLVVNVVNTWEEA